MRKVIALFLSILMFMGSLFPQTDIEEVYKIPGLLTHFQEHRAKLQPNLSFWGFLKMHYSPSSEHAKTPHPHTKIPFYNHASAGFLFVISEFKAALEKPLITFFSCNHHFQYLNAYAYQTYVSLLRPPQQF